MRNSKSILSLFLREARRIPKDHSLLLTLIIAPLLYAFFYGSIYLNKFEEEVAVAIVDVDNSEMSRNLIRQLDATPQIKVISVQPSAEYADELFKLEEVQVVIHFERGLENNVKLLKGTTVFLKSNASRFLPANDIVQAATKVFMTAGVGVRMEYYKAKGHYADVALQMANPVEINYKPLFNKNLSYGSFLLPGLLILILQQTLLLGLAEGTSREREKGTLKDWMLQSKNTMHALFGKASFYLFLFASFAVFFQLVNSQMLSINNNSSLLTLVILFALFFSCIIPFGMWVGLLIKKELLAMQIMAFSSYPLFLLSGYSWPQSALPVWLQVVSNLIPTTPMLDAYIKATQQGATLSTLAPQCLHLLILAIVFWVLCYYQLSKVKQTLKIL